MGLHKGKTNNPRGRAKGSQNRLTSNLRGMIQQIIENNMELFENDIKSLKPKDRLLIIEKLLQYVIPRKREEDVTLDENAGNTLFSKFFNENEPD